MEKEKIKVTFFLPSLEPGGAERNVVNLVNNIDKKKYEVFLLLGKKKGDFLKELDGKTPVADLNAESSLKLLFLLIRYFKKEKPDIFVSAFPRINIISVVAKIFSGAKTKIIITEHSVYSFLPVIARTFWRRVFARLFMPTLGRFFYPKANAIICVSKGIADDLLKIINRPPKIKVIYNPVLDDKIYELSGQQVSHLWFSDSKIPIIIAAGRLVRIKGYPFLLKAFSLIIQSRSARLVILGSGPEKFFLVNLAAKLGVSEKVDFLGFQKNPYKYIKSSSVFVLSSIQEGFGNVIVEAMALGVPVVSTDCPTGPSEIIQNGKNGLLVPPKDYKAMAKAIIEILDDVSLSRKLSEKGKKRAEDFLVGSGVRKYEEVFEELTQ